MEPDKPKRPYNPNPRKSRAGIKAPINSRTITFLKTLDNTEQIWGINGLSSFEHHFIYEIVKKFIGKKWHFGRYGLSMNSGINPEFIEKFPGCKWHWGSGGISSNPNVTENFILKNLDKPWNMSIYGLSAIMVPSNELLLYFPANLWDPSLFKKPIELCEFKWTKEINETSGTSDFSEFPGSEFLDFKENVNIFK